ncbi:MAG: hypothetical protein ABI718_03465 [Acidobacteriota bacterium]
MNIVPFVFPAFLAALISYALTPMVRRAAIATGAMDHPGSRKVHTAPVPRLGGLAVIASVVIVVGGLCLFQPVATDGLFKATDFYAALALGAAPILFVSFWDDFHSVAPVPKLLCHILGASIAIGMGIHLPETVQLFGNVIHLGYFSIPISLVWLVGVTNAFNLVDGLDGLSAGLALISAISLGCVSALVGLYPMAAASLVLAGALVGFLPSNIYPAKVFLGDSGATFLGFCLASLALKGGSAMTAGMAVLVPMVVMGVPVAETMISLARRMLRNADHLTGNGVFQADRQHFHHRLLDLGLDHRRAVLTLYGVGIAFAFCGLASLFMKSQSAAVLLLSLIFASFIGLNRLGYDEFAMIRRGVVRRMYSAPVLKAALFSVLLDVVMIVTSIYLAIGLKFDNWSLSDMSPLAAMLVLFFTPVTLATFYMARLYRGSWRQATLEDLMRSSIAVFAATAIGYVLAVVFMHEAPGFSFLAIYSLILMAMVNSSRASYRILSHWTSRASSDGERVIIYGAGREGSVALREVLSNQRLGLSPVGFIDDDPDKSGMYVNGYPVVGAGHDLEKLLERQAIRGVLVSTRKITPERLGTAALICESRAVWMREFLIEMQTLTIPYAPFDPFERPRPVSAQHEGAEGYGWDVEQPESEEPGIPEVTRLGR